MNAEAKPATAGRQAAEQWYGQGDNVPPGPIEAYAAGYDAATAKLDLDLRTCRWTIATYMARHNEAENEEILREVTNWRAQNERGGH